MAIISFLAIEFWLDAQTEANKSQLHFSTDIDFIETTSVTALILHARARKWYENKY